MTKVNQPKNNVGKNFMTYFKRFFFSSNNFDYKDEFSIHVCCKISISIDIYTQSK